MLTIILISSFIFIGLFNTLNSSFVSNASAGSGDPPINGTTTNTWYVDGQITRNYEWINTSKIQINTTGSMNWTNIKAIIDGDIIINNNSYFNITNSNIILNGDLIINGSANFINVTFKINSTTNGEYSIIVNDKGDFNISNSNFTAYNYVKRYKFIVYGNLNLNTSNISRMWGNPQSFGYTIGGLQIYSDNVIISNSDIYDNYAGNEMGCGIYLSSSSARIINNTIKKNDNGIINLGTSTPIIEGNNISWSLKRGLLNLNSKPIVNNNTFTRNDWEAVLIGGVTKMCLFNNTFISNYIGSPTYGDMSIHNSNVTLKNNTHIDLRAGGIYSSDSNLEIIDCTFINVKYYSYAINLWKNVNLDVTNSSFSKSNIDIGTNCQVNFLNLKYNHSLVTIGESSNLTVKWYLHINVHSNDNKPMSNTDLIVKDAYNNIIANKKMDSNGIAKWIICTGFIQNKTLINYSMNNYNITVIAKSIEQIKFINMSLTKWANFTYCLSPVWDDIPDLHILEDTQYLDWVNLNEYVLDIDTPLENIDYSIIYQSNKSKINVSIDNNDNIDIEPLIENFYGSSTITVRADDGDFISNENFTIYMDPVNDLPIIETEDIININEDEYYENIYYTIDVDMGDVINWTYNSNATWLHWGNENHSLYGTPQNEDVGIYWVRINVSDNNGGYDEHNFTLTVNNTNDPPVINTTDITEINEDENYEVQYTATDVDFNDKLIWKYTSNANWLNWGFKNHILYGIPRNEDIGEYWVDINITDGNGGYDKTHFVLIVINVNDAPEINNSIADISIQEDSIDYQINLYDWFKDIDNDHLIYSYKGDNNIDVKILKNGTIELFPKSNWNGQEVLIFYANDSVSEISDDIKITVLPVNDAPVNVIIMLTEMIYYEKGLQPAVGNATDVDITYGDKLTFTWYSNISSKIGIGQEINLSLTAGMHTIILNVTDQKGMWSTASIEREILKTDIDNDGYPDDIDAFPNDSTQWLDCDGDNFGDNLNGINPDIFPNDPLEWIDSDGDNFGNNIDVFPNNSSEWNDTDGDNMGDNIDAYPNDPGRWKEEDDQEEKNNQDENDAIGIIIGVVIMIILIIIFVFLLLIKRKKKEKVEQDTTTKVVQEITLPSQNQPYQPQQAIQQSQQIQNFTQPQQQLQMQHQQSQP